GRETDIDLGAFPRGYRQMAIDPYRIARYREVLVTTMADHRQPLLFHCTAGKDRTGWTAALLLLLLGVAREAVTDDYMRTNEIRTEHNVMVVERHRTMLARRRSVDPATVPDDDLAAIRSLVEVRRDYLDNAFAAVDEAYGGFDRYRRDALGLDDHAVDSFRASILV
ncbi:MAG: tyrosine-protein phosphatase, partial [Acidimicrobiia bacterium]|nr:tyrosine-protein phosphatase [Acidimicrobiia bacterium]